MNVSPVALVLFLKDICSESSEIKEYDFYLLNYGQFNVEFLFDFFVLDCKTRLVHCNKLSFLSLLFCAISCFTV